MNQLMKILAIGVTASMAAFCFSGCGGSSATTSTASSSVTTTTAAAANYKLVTSGKLIMGTNAEFPPFEYMESNEVVGVDASIMEAVAKKLGLELEISNMDFDTLSVALGNKQIDVIAAGFTVTADREEAMDFSDSYYTAMQTIIVKSDSAIASKDDLSGKKIGVQTGTTGDIDAKDLTDDANISRYGNGALAVEALLSGSVDAVIIDNNPAKEYKSQHSDALKLLENQFDGEDYAIAVQKGNSALQDAINTALAEMKADGSLQTIMDEYIK